MGCEINHGLVDHIPRTNTYVLTPEGAGSRYCPASIVVADVEVRDSRPNLQRTNDSDH
jgi:hypothetical protein